jgi:hypothetical protein
VNIPHRIALFFSGRWLPVCLILAVAGFLRIAVERDMETEFKDQGFRDWSPGLSSRDQLTQAAFVGAMGGFRSLVASVYHLKAHNAFVKKNWGEVERLRTVTASLQPKFWRYWDTAVWDMAWNAFGYYRGEAEDSGDDLNSWYIENIVMPTYLQKGIDFAKRGQEWLPDDYRLLKVIADIYTQKMSNPEKAAEWYLKASRKPGAPPHVYRAYAHQLTLCEGMAEEAYRVNEDLYRNSGEITLTLLRDLERLEEDVARRAVSNMSYEELRAAALAEGAGYLEMASLGTYLLEVSKDLPAAIDIYGKVAGHPLAPSFYRRKLAFVMLKDPKHTGRAYQMLKALALRDPASMRREDIKEIARLESRLGIPKAERLRP